MVHSTHIYHIFQVVEKNPFFTDFFPKNAFAKIIEFSSKMRFPLKYQRNISEFSKLVTI